MQVVPKQIKMKKKRQTQKPSQKNSNSSINQHSVNSIVLKELIQTKDDFKGKTLTSKQSTVGNEYRRLDSTKRRKHRQIKAKLSKATVNQFIEPPSPDPMQKKDSSKINIYFYHNKISSPSVSKIHKNNTKIDQEQGEFSQLARMKKTSTDFKLRLDNQSRIPQKNKLSKWKKLQHLFGGLLRFRTQDAVKIVSPDQIIDEINRVQQPKDFSFQIAPKIKKIPEKSNNNPDEKKRNNKAQKPQKNNKIILDVHNQNELDDSNRLDAGDFEAMILNGNKQNQNKILQLQTTQQQNKYVVPIQNQKAQKKKKIQTAPKVREIDYFRKIRRFHEAASRGSAKDEKKMMTELKTDLKKHMWTRSDPQHLINIKNVFGQTPLYVACENGNLNIVKMLVANGANVFIKSNIDKENEENNLQCAARWKYFDIVKYLIENMDWTKQDLKEAILIPDLQRRIKNLLIDHYQLRYGKIYCMRCCFNFWN
ncbi:UNKNOWN [Stylonychia lemnae]|uniref:Uncharacterized protein n=1 Tax=Stylonychia lemnae TaxID=5949 RepID=A0A078B8W0_STYLE|nr:UNKNOWN [Stylonychia lemnae]|eukprot:CDW90849.1 UNKNOWN [Stylonychia lemnae]